jgi:predicted N-formylglutamate amidohydrolase
VEHFQSEAVDVFRSDEPNPAVLLSSEHASARLPKGWTWAAADQRLIASHWAFDLGAADLTKELAQTLDATAVLSRFSRLLADPNRHLDADDLFRKVADGEPVHLNQNVDAGDRERRISGYWEPYHATIDRELTRTSAPVLLSIHTFTPNYQGELRRVEVGVLFDDPEEREAEILRSVIAKHGFDTRMNEPYSGRGGMMYAANRHARKHQRIALELEVRQDLAVEHPVRLRISAAIREALDAILGR